MKHLETDKASCVEIAQTSPFSGLEGTSERVQKIQELPPRKQAIQPDSLYKLGGNRDGRQRAQPLLWLTSLTKRGQRWPLAQQEPSTELRAASYHSLSRAPTRQPTRPSAHLPFA